VKTYIVINAAVAALNGLLYVQFGHTISLVAAVVCLFAAIMMLIVNKMEH
jgi:hypothetical protein